MEVVSSLFVSLVVASMLRYAFGKQISNALVFTVFTLVFVSLTILAYLAEPFTLPFQAGLAIVFIVALILLLTLMPPQKIDREKEEGSLKVTEKDNAEMAKVGLFFLALTLLTGYFIFIAA